MENTRNIISNAHTASLVDILKIKTNLIENFQRETDIMTILLVKNSFQLENLFTQKSLSLQYVLFLQIDWDVYIGHYILGARHFLLKEKPETLPKARIFLRRLYLLDKFMSLVFYALILWLIYLYWSNIIFSFENFLDQSADFINQRFAHRGERIRNE